jgi:predicted transposase/invertase (TIGR01784 family)
MRTDTIFYQLFKAFNSLLFELLNLPVEEGYQFTSVEVKEKSFRLDGIFAPSQADKLIYFIEVQFQPKPSFYGEFLGEVFLYLSQFDPKNDWKIVAIFGKRSLEPTGITTFQGELIDSGRIVRVYLDELKTEASIGIAIIQLITSSSQDALKLVTEIKAKISNQLVSQDIMELIETVILYKFKNLSREAIEAMFALSDLKQTKVYQEALQEGEQIGERKGEQKGEQKGLLMGKEIATQQFFQALSLLKSETTTEKVAEITGLNIEQVKQLERSLEGKVS